jgi:hypothetical protein
MIVDFHTHIFPSFFRDQRDLFFQEEPASGKNFSKTWMRKGFTGRSFLDFLGRKMGTSEGTMTTS